MIQMSRRSLIIFLGIFVALLPFLGFPLDWHSSILIGAGALIVLIEIYDYLLEHWLKNLMIAEEERSVKERQTSSQPSSDQTEDLDVNQDTDDRQQEV